MSPAVAAYGYATIVAAGFAFFLAQIPVQVSDCINNIGAAFTSSWYDLLAGPLGSRAFMRPLLNAPTKAVLEVARGHEYAAFRLVQVLQVFALFWLLVRVLRVRTWPEAAGALVAVVVLGGSHAFAALVREGYPVNTYLTVALCALTALNVSMEPRPRWWTDVLVIAAFVLAVGTIETGLLVWVAVVAGALAGARGVSRPGLAALSVLVAAYVVLRVFVFDVGTPDLLERSSGFGFERLEPGQLVERFGANPLPFYAYNVASSISTVLFSEPRDGVIRIGRAIVDGEVRPWMIVHVLSGIAATALLAWYAVVVRWRRPASEWAGGQRVLFVAAGVLVANATISYPYTKDQIMSVAALFVAAAVSAPAAMLAARLPRAPWARGAALALLLATSALWSLRVAGLQHLLVHTAFVTRNDWATVDPAAAVRPFGSDPDLLALITALRTTALTKATAYPDAWSSPLAEDWFGH
jgi:hypothetical protein